MRPRGPKDQKNSRFRSRLKISIENEIFERATHRGPFFCGEIETSRLKYSIEIKNFDRDLFFLSLGPLGTSPSLLKDDQNLCDNRVTVQWRRAGCRASPYRHPGCHANVVPPGSRSPPLKKYPMTSSGVRYGKSVTRSVMRCFVRLQISGQVRPRQGTEICNFGAPSPLEALHWIFCFFSSVYVQFSKTSPLKSGESCEKSSGENRVKSCHVCGCHGFFRLRRYQFFSEIITVTDAVTDTD